VHMLVASSMPNEAPTHDMAQAIYYQRINQT
jgi:hypothetical protein